MQSRRCFAMEGGGNGCPLVGKSTDRNRTWSCRGWESGPPLGSPRIYCIGPHLKEGRKHEVTLCNSGMGKSKFGILGDHVLGHEDIEVEGTVPPMCCSSSPRLVFQKDTAIQQLMRGQLGVKEGDRVEEPSSGRASAHGGTHPQARHTKEGELGVRVKCATGQLDPSLSTT
jgi:hypothetical protein